MSYELDVLEQLYLDDLVIVAEKLDEHERRLNKWKERLKDKRCKASIRKTKVICWRHNATKTKSNQENPLKLFGWQVLV